MSFCGHSFILYVSMYLVMCSVIQIFHLFNHVYSFGSVLLKNAVDHGFGVSLLWGMKTVWAWAWGLIWILQGLSVCFDSGVFMRDFGEIGPQLLDEDLVYFAGLLLASEFWAVWGVGTVLRVSRFGSC